MEVKAEAKSVRISPRKVRLIVDSVRSLSLDDALNTLSLTKKRGASDIYKTLKSAIANASSNNKLNKTDLKIKSIDVLEAPSYKRFHSSTRGRVHPYKRRGSHIRIILTDNKLVVSNLKSEVNIKKEKAQDVQKKGEQK